MKLIDLKVVSQKIHIKQNYITYETDVTSGPGIILMADSTGEKGMVLVDQVHNKGPVILKMKPVTTPARKYEVGEIAGKLLVFE